MENVKALIVSSVATASLLALQSLLHGSSFTVDTSLPMQVANFALLMPALWFVLLSADGAEEVESNV